jgi:hypothetical protein
MPTLTMLDEAMDEMGLKYGPCWVTLLDEEGNELSVVRKVAKLIQQTPVNVTWEPVFMLVPARYAVGADRRRPRTVFVAAAGTPCGKPATLGAVQARPEELITIMPRVSVSPEGAQP